MYVHVHSKIELSSDLEVTSIAWGGDNDYIACGTSNGTIKLLSSSDNDGTDDSNVTITVIDRLLHETQGRINKLLFDMNENKLTSTDDLGLICVWKYNNVSDSWIKEMSYDRGKIAKSFVTDFCWSQYDNKIGIIYRDGFCLVGNKIGDREWSNQFDFELKLIEWSPHGKYLLIVTMNYELLLYKKQDTHKYIRFDTINLCFYDKLSNDALEIADIKWNSANNILCIAYKIGKIQLMRDYNDSNPILIDIDMIILKIQYNPNGNIIAIVGRKKINQKYTNWLCFIDCFGQILYELSISSSSSVSSSIKKINDFCWESNGLRIIVCIENIMYFAEIKTNYKYSYFANSFLCFSNNNILTNLNNSSEIVYFANNNSDIINEKKFIGNIISIAGNYESEYALIVHEDNKVNKNKIFGSLYNSIGREIMKNEINFLNPNIFIVTSLFAIIGSKYIIYYFQHSHNKKLIESGFHLSSTTSLINKLYHIDNKSDIHDKSQNPIQSICGCNEYIIIARKFGDIVCYSMLSEIIKFKFDTKNQGINKISANKDISRLSIINKNGSLQIYDIKKEIIIVERNNKINNIRDIIWSYSDKLRFAIIDKSKLIIYDDLKYQDKAYKINNNNLCLFKDLEIITFNFDNYRFIKYDCKTLTTIKDLLLSQQSSHQHSKSAYNMIIKLTQNDNTHNFNKLWELLCYHSLKKLDFKMAEICFIKMNDFFGIQFIKRLKLIKDEHKQRAEIYSYFGEINESEKIYNKINDKFEILNLYLKIGDFEKIINLMKGNNKSHKINDKIINNLYKEIGNFYESQFNWNEALKYYLKSKDFKNAINAAYKIEDFVVLSQIIKQLPSSSTLLKKISKMFIVNGLTQESCEALIKYGDILTAINNCIQYNDYKLALDLSIKYEKKDYFNKLIDKKIALINNRNVFEIIDIYKSINQYLKTAKLLISYIEKLKQQNKNKNTDPYLFQKLYVLSAIEIDKHRKELLLQTEEKTNQKTIDLLLETEEEEDINNIFGIKCWNGAIAYHLYILLQKQIHNHNINNNSLFMCRVLCEFYDDFLNEINIYSLYAFVSYKLNYFKDCSNAMTRLQFLCDRKNDKLLKKQYKTLAINIFTKNDPINDYKNHKGKSCHCKNINDTDFNINNICMASGQYIKNSHIDSQSFRICNVCKYKTLKEFITYQNNYCPLCHSLF